MIKVESYYEAFCPVCHYRCLMPVEYQGVDENSIMYQKVRCVCARAKSGECDKSTSCDHYQTAPEEIDITVITHM